MKKYVLLFFISIVVLVLLGYSFRLKVSAQTSCTANPNPTIGRVVLLATIAHAGSYGVWSRMKAADTNNNSFYIQIGSGCPILVGDSPQISSTDWTWVDYHSGADSNKINTILTTGVHTITVIGNEPSISIDKILLTQDFNCVPIGSGGNCPAVTPNPTPAQKDKIKYE